MEGFELAPPPHGHNFARVPRELVGRIVFTRLPRGILRTVVFPSLTGRRRGRGFRGTRSVAALESELQLPAGSGAALGDLEHGDDGCGWAEAPGAEGCPRVQGVSPGRLRPRGRAAAAPGPPAARARALASRRGIHPQEEGQEPHEGRGAGVGPRLSLRDPPLPLH